MRSVLLTGVIALALGCGACGGSTDGTSSASCVGPYLDDQPPGEDFGARPPVLHPGETLTLYGHWFTETCNDTGEQDPVEPMPPVQLTLVLPGGAVADLGTFTPGGSDLGFSTDVVVPAGTPAGFATVNGHGAYPTAYRFRVGR